ncbi:hypothetical protein QTG56_25210 (plasmid) [Rossellomorea sp. AcN35-11]|nr:hypothetical protein [Rossellomorea aquimaris]WJV31934.1 hypothetical protein QTG56_25210 [Rossellomorea sp. AcN35-11]
MSKISRKKYTRLYTQVDDLKRTLDINQSFSLKSYKSDIIDGAATPFNNIRLSKPVLDLYGTEFENALYFMLAHELVHIKFNDSGLKRGWWALTGTFGNNRSRALILLMETRANVMANASLGFSDEQIIKIQTHIQEHNNNPKGKDSYKLGYPDRTSISDFSCKYREFNEDLMRELLEDFCRVMNINNDKFIVDVIETFNKKCN